MASKTLWAAWGLTALAVALKIVGVIVAARLLIVLANTLIDRLAASHHERRSLLDERRTQTLAGVARSVVRYFFDFFAGVTVLSLAGVDTSSILLGAGVAGLAVGFGAQNLVRDVISGFFILLEDQYAVGDYVNLAGTEGVVEDLGLRTTSVRAFGGELHILPNGAIPLVTNYSRGPLRVMFEVTVPYEEDTPRAIGVIQGALDKAARGSPLIVEGPRVLGVSSLGPTGVRLLVWGRAKAMEHWGVERDLRLAVKEALERAKIDIPHAPPLPGLDRPPAKAQPTRAPEGE